MPAAQGPLFRYRDLVTRGELRDDAAQRLAIEKLQLLDRRLQGYNPARPSRFGLGLFGWGRENFEQVEVQGLYLYGGVGRGKSMLMDLFFETAPVAKKRRVHFHAFMQEVHGRIASARKTHEKDPIEPVAMGIAAKATLLCFDELQIGDITDLQLVKAQQCGLGSNAHRHRLNRVFLVGFAGRGDTAMHLLHEGMKMHPAFFGHGRGFEKQVHQHRFAPPDSAIKIKPLHLDLLKILSPPAKQPQTKAAGPGRVIALQAPVQQLQFFNGEALGGVIAQLTPGDQVTITKKRALCSGHGNLFG